MLRLEILQGKLYLYGKYCRNSSNRKGGAVKNRIKLWLLAAVLVAGLFADAAPRAKESRIVIPRELTLVRLSLVSPPRISHDQQGNEKSTLRKWLQVRIAYQFNPSFRFKPFFTYDDMRVEIYMRVTPSNGTWRGLRWFTGTQYLYKVIPEGKTREKHGVSFFMPPGIIHNYAKRNEKSLLKDCEGIIFFYNGDRLLGRAFFDGSSSSARQLEKKAAKIYAEYKLIQKNPNLLIKDGLWPREMTPWHYLDADRFDLPRPRFHAGASANVSSPAPEEEKEEKSESSEKNRDSAKAEDEEEQDMKFTRSSSNKKKKKSRGRK